MIIIIIDILESMPTKANSKHPKKGTLWVRSGKRRNVLYILPRDVTVKHALGVNIYSNYVIMFHMLHKVDQHEDIVQEI